MIDAYAELAQDTRQGEVPHLKAGHLLPGDLVMIEGWTLTVDDVSRKAGRVALDFGDYHLMRDEDELVEVVRLAASAPCSTRVAQGGGLWL